MKSWLAGALAALALVACSGGGRSTPDAATVDARAGAGDARPPDAPVPDAPVPDTRPPDAPLPDAAPPDAGSPDPATCPIGLADGCCPIAVMYGGMDPDCPSLACTAFHRGDPIPLDSLDQNTGSSAVGMAWTGSELALAWTTVISVDSVRKSALIFEKRDATGALTLAPVIISDTHAQAFTSSLGGNELAFHPESRQFLFVGDNGQLRSTLLLDGNGAPTGQQTSLGATCNGITERYRIFPSPGRFLVAQSHYTCDGSLARSPRVDVLGLDGARLSMATTTDGYYVSPAYDAVHDQVFFLYYTAATLYARTFTPPATWSDGQLLSREDMDDTDVAFDGTRYGIAYGRYYFDGENVADDPRFGVLTPGQPFGTSDLVGDLHQLQIPPRALWTGNGWLVFTSVYPSNDLGLPDSYSQFTSWAYSLAPDGTLREKFQVGGAGTFAVNAIVADGKVAISYVTSADGVADQHFLQWLDCPIN